MSTIQELLRELCPNGVEHRTLGEISSFYSGLTGKTKHDFEDGNAPFLSYKTVFANLAIPNDVADKVRISPGEKQNAIHFGDIIFTGSSETQDEAGITCVATREPRVPLYLNSFCFGCRIQPGLLLPEFAKFLFRSCQLRKQIAKTASGVTRYNISKDRLARIRIPLPPLPVQEEIVRRLDAMQDVVEALENELTLRRKQYEAVRERLIDGAAAGAECKTLGEISHYSKERCDATSITREQYVCVESLLQNKAGRTLAASVPQSGGLVAFRSGDILIGNIRPYLRKIWFSDCDGGTNGDVLVIVANNRKEIEPRFLFHALLSERFFIHSVSGMKEGKMPRGDKATIMKYSIPVPPLPVQEEIAKKLDAFDELVNVALPAEIAARRRAMEAVRERCFAALEAAE